MWFNGNVSSMTSPEKQKVDTYPRIRRYLPQPLSSKGSICHHELSLARIPMESARLHGHLFIFYIIFIHSHIRLC